MRPGFFGIVLVAAICAAGCGDEREPAGEQARENTARPLEGEVPYDSIEGGYSVVFPSGCARINLRTQEDPDSEDPEELVVVYAFCDREGHENEGCAVRTYLKLRDENGGPPTPDLVIERVKAGMTSFGVDIVTQRPVQRGSLAGVQVHCREPGETGEVWIEGLLHGDRAYVLTAWKASGNLFAAPEYIRFFDSFEVPAEPSAD